MAKITVLGECMVELSPIAPVDGQPAYRMGFAGDTFNTSVYMARLGDRVAYCTALGEGDPFSEGVLGAMHREGLDTSLIREAPGRLPGLYAIQLDDSGERRFYYWRELAPIRDMFSMHSAEMLFEAAQNSDLVYLSGVTLAVIGDIGRSRLKDILATIAADGVAVALDFNYRPALWPSVDAAREALDGVVPSCRYISLSSEDSRPLYGREADDLAARVGQGRPQRSSRGTRATQSSSTPAVNGSPRSRPKPSSRWTRPARETASTPPIFPPVFPGSRWPKRWRAATLSLR